MKKIILSAAAVIFGVTVGIFSPVIHADDTLPEVTEMCQCLEKGMKSQDKAEKRKCLALQEKHVKKLKEGSDAHKKYSQGVAACERKLTQVSPEGLSYEQKVRKVCECFEKARNEKRPPMACFKMQHDFGESEPARKEEFTRETNLCAG